MLLVTFALLLGVTVASETFFEEKFDTIEWESRWVHSKWKGSNGPAGKFEWSAGDWYADEKEQRGLRTPKNMNYHSISAKMAKPFSNRGRDLVVQFSVKHEAQEFSFCGGGYIKLLGSDFDQAAFGGPTPYKIMFGPDICGYDVARIHLIFNWKGDNLLRRPDIGLEYDDKNEFTHLYTLVLKPDNTYAVYLDLKEKSSGSLHDHWDFPNRTHNDPSDAKPRDWVDVQKMDDPSKTKPDDWVDEQRIRDPTAERPSEWDEDEDGVWEAPMIDNPKYKGAWFPQQIDNPLYKGEWRPRQLENPDFVEEVYPFDDIGGVGFELWTVNKGSIFDNILVCDSFEHAKSVGEELKKVFAKEKDAKKAWEKANGKDKDKDTDSSSAGVGGDEDDDDETPEEMSKAEL
mmetsp:Transcript_24969/g.58069  ORF Transcript_24969/g.58069 Transcript_24969/m.58069 type:complete len:401 (-) Transcript_24969:87-1289(-)